MQFYAHCISHSNLVLQPASLLCPRLDLFHSAHWPEQSDEAEAAISSVSYPAGATLLSPAV
jgi:hypothetical protein